MHFKLFKVAGHYYYNYYHLQELGEFQNHGWQWVL